MKISIYFYTLIVFLEAKAIMNILREDNSLLLPIMRDCFLFAMPWEALLICSSPSLLICVSSVYTQDKTCQEEYFYTRM